MSRSRQSDMFDEFDPCAPTEEPATSRRTNSWLGELEYTPPPENVLEQGFPFPGRGGFDETPISSRCRKDGRFSMDSTSYWLPLDDRLTPPPEKYRNIRFNPAQQQCTNYDDMPLPTTRHLQYQPPSEYITDRASSRPKPYVNYDDTPLPTQRHMYQPGRGSLPGHTMPSSSQCQELISFDDAPLPTQRPREIINFDDTPIPTQRHMRQSLCDTPIPEEGPVQRAPPREIINFDDTPLPTQRHMRHSMGSMPMHEEQPVQCAAPREFVNFDDTPIPTQRHMRHSMGSMPTHEEQPIQCAPQPYVNYDDAPLPTQRHLHQPEGLDSVGYSVPLACDEDQGPPERYEGQQQQVFRPCESPQYYADKEKRDRRMAYSRQVAERNCPR